MHIWLANHPPVSIWPERKEREGERHVAGSHIPFLLEKYKALWPHVRCQRKPVFILKQKQTLTQLSTPKHIHPHSWRLHTEYYCSWLQLFWLESLRGKANTQVTPLHVSVKIPLFSANYSSLSHYWPLFLSCWVKCGWAYLGLAKLNGCYLAWPAGELCITHLDLKTSYFPLIIVFLTPAIIQRKKKRMIRKMCVIEQQRILTYSFMVFFSGRHTSMQDYTCMATHTHTFLSVQSSWK